MLDGQMPLQLPAAIRASLTGCASAAEVSAEIAEIARPLHLERFPGGRV